MEEWLRIAILREDLKKISINAFEVQNWEMVLIKAIEHKATKIIQYLVNRGLIDLSKKLKQNGQLPLSLAVKYQELTTIKCLLDNGARSTISEVLEDAIEIRSLKIVKFLVEEGADINYIKNIHSYSPIGLAVKLKAKDIVAYFLNQEADIYISGMHREKPLSIAVRDKDLDMVKFLQTKDIGLTIQQAFRVAIETKNLEMVKHLKESGAAVNFIYIYGSGTTTPLTIALQDGTDSIVSYLLESGAEKIVDHCKLAEYLMKHVELHNFKMVKCLIEQMGADINSVDKNGKCALAIASSKGYFQLAKYLIESGANLKLAKSELEEFAKMDENFYYYVHPKLAKSTTVSEDEAAETA